MEPTLADMDVPAMRGLFGDYTRLLNTTQTKPQYLDELHAAFDALGGRSLPEKYSFWRTLVSEERQTFHDVFLSLTNPNYTE